MHETSIVQNLLELIHEHLAAQGPVRVRTVRVRVGALAGVAAEAFRSAFASGVRGTIADGARLDLRATPVTAWCRACIADRQIATPQRLVCPVCGRPTPDLTGGHELELDWLEVIDLPENTHAPATASRPI
jgi:hydrogenase nickel incorporation protein HypA/HybF